MTTRDTPFVPGTPCWVDLFSSDVDKAKAFYTELFGWTFQDVGEEFGGYVNFHSDGHPVAGMMQNTPESGSPDAWSTYISTADIGGIVDLEVKLGAQVGDADVRHLLWLRDRIGDDLLEAMVVTTGPYAYRRSDGIIVVPAALLGP